MSATRSPLTADALPQRLADAFRLLKSGRHICLEDGSVYRDLEADEDRYRLVFSGLGFELVRDGHGFYYLKGKPTLTSRRLQAITLFLMILFQDLEDRKMQDGSRAWVQSLTTRIFDIKHLPHFSTTQLRGLMVNLGITSESLLVQVLGPLRSLGMLEFVGEDRFRFRAPVHRFVDLTLNYADQDWEQADHQDNAFNESDIVEPFEEDSQQDGPGTKEEDQT